MALSPVNSWDTRLLIDAEASFGTAAVPADVSAYAATAVEHIDADLGDVEQGATRGKADRNLGRGMQSAFVEGRVPPIPWKVVLSCKSRSAIDAVPREGTAIYKAAGLVRTVNGSTSYTLTPSATPIESGDFVSATLRRFAGSGAAAFEAETLRGCICDKMTWTGGDKEVTLEASGLGIGKYHQGSIDSITLASGIATSLPHTAAESYLLDTGYYLCESEILSIARASVGYGSTSSTIVRAALASTGASHSSKPLYPYIPTGITFAGSPIAEPNATVSIDGETIRVLSWSAELSTGMGLLSGETGSAYIQGAKYGRYDLAISCRLVLSGTQVQLLNKATQRATAGALAVSLSQGTGTGAVWTLASTYCELMPFKVPSTPNDVAIVDVKLRVRDNASGNNAFTITLT